MSIHPWQFFVAGGVNQVRLETADDLRNLRHLDPKLWVALSCPVRGHAMDVRTMDLMDTDSDGRVRVAEVLAAVDFLLAAVRNPAEIFTDPKGLPFAAIREDTPEGRAIMASARAIVTSLGREYADVVRLEDIADVPAIFAQMPLNGDGIVHAGATEDPELKALVAEIIGTVGGERDRSGQDGVSAARVEQFFAACTEFAAWGQRGAADRPLLFPADEGTDAALAALAAVTPKIDDFFARCRLVAFDARRTEALDGGESIADVALISGDCAEFGGLPLARVGAGGALPLLSGVNPAWSSRIASFVSAVVAPTLGVRPALTEADWRMIQATFSAAAAWRAAPGGTAVAGLGSPRIRTLLLSDLKARLLELLAADEARRPEAEAIGRVEQAVRYYTQLGRLLRNFVNFSAFYGRQEKAIFQAGTAYFDQRSCDLAMRVEDAGRHATMAGFAGAYLAYLDCTRGGRVLQPEPRARHLPWPAKERVDGLPQRRSPADRLSQARHRAVRRRASDHPGWRYRPLHPSPPHTRGEGQRGHPHGKPRPPRDGIDPGDPAR